MKAISMWQPWASLWIAQPDAKVHETRSWPTKIRGELAVHASKRECEELIFTEGYEDAVRILGVNFEDKLPLGAIIGIVDLVDCVPTEHGPASAVDGFFGNWSSGRYAWKRGPVVHRLAQPVPCRGFQGIWVLHEDIERQVREQMAKQREAA